MHDRGDLPVEQAAALLLCLYQMGIRVATLYPSYSPFLDELEIFQNLWLVRFLTCEVDHTLSAYGLLLFSLHGCSSIDGGAKMKEFFLSFWVLASAVALSVSSRAQAIGQRRRHV